MGNVIIKNIPEDAITRFFSKFEKSDPDKCWEWNGQRDKDGYGKFSYRIKPYRYFERAHRISAAIYLGDVIGKAVVMHKCDNPCCVNPNHLKIGTHLENEQDKDAKGRRPLDHIIKYTEDQIRDVFCMVLDGEYTKNISKKTGIPMSTIQQFYSVRNPCNHRYNRAIKIYNSFSNEDRKLIDNNIENKGERSTSAKISEKDVLDIRIKNILGQSLGSITKSYPVHRAQIERICKKQRWKHVKDPDCYRQPICNIYGESFCCPSECNGYVY